MNRRGGLLWLSGALLCALFLALGVWQVQRLAWKNGLIARVEARVQAAPVAAPAATEWPAVVADPLAFEYRTVRLSGQFLHQHEQLVQAVTDRGAGFWVLTPLQTEAGAQVWVNRGFVPSRTQWLAAGGQTRCAGPVVLSGLLRRTEPGGGFLRRNDPESGRWHSRDVAALSTAAALAPASVAPFFIDAAADTPCTGTAGPVGGLTVLRFTNNHLVYALTWFTLAGMVVATMVFVARDQARRRLAGQSASSS